MKPYAVIETGGKQYRVSQDETVKVEKLDANAGSDITFDRVLALSDGKVLSVGAPHLDGVAIQATVLEHARGRKVVSFKYKKRKGFKKTIGHRQEFTTVKILSFSDEPEAGKPDKQDED